MTTIKIKGHDIQPVHIKDSCDRRALQIKNNIIKMLKAIGVVEDDVEIPLEPVALKRAPASVAWYLDHQHLYYSYGSAGKFVENLAIVHKVLELEILAVAEGKKSVDDFILEFKEDQDITDQRKKARDALGLEHDVKDMGIIDKAYKDLAKEHHPDKESGDTAKFKEINNAHKILKRELQ